MVVDSIKCSENVRMKILQKHAIILDEVEEIFENNSAMFRKSGIDRMLVFGRTDAGRYLFCVISRPEKIRNRKVCRLITARPMKQGERKAYKRKRGLR